MLLNQVVNHVSEPTVLLTLNILQQFNILVVYPFVVCVLQNTRYLHQYRCVYIPFLCCFHILKTFIFNKEEEHSSKRYGNLTSLKELQRAILLCYISIEKRRTL